MVEDAADLDAAVANCLRVLMDAKDGEAGALPDAPASTDEYVEDFTKARHIRRPQAQDIIGACFEGG